MTTGQRPEDVHRTIEIASAAHRLGTALRDLRAALAAYDAAPGAARAVPLASSARDLFAALDADVMP